MTKVIVVNKKEGETPLEALNILRRRNQKYRGLKMTYAGRLDPMASGLLLVLTGEETKNKEKYLALSKEYDFEVLFGFATDTYDILGKVTFESQYTGKNNDLEKKIKENLKHFSGKFNQKYPVYSSKTVAGKPLFEYGRSGMDVKVPAREVRVADFKFFKLRKINNVKLLANIEKRIKKVKGDFRQKEIIKIWRSKLLPASADLSRIGKNFFIANLKIKCSSGTYIRAIADGLGGRLGIPALAFSIKRTKVGKFSKIS